MEEDLRTTLSSKPTTANILGSSIGFGSRNQRMSTPTMRRAPLAVPPLGSEPTLCAPTAAASIVLQIPVDVQKRRIRPGQLLWDIDGGDSEVEDSDDEDYDDNQS